MANHLDRCGGILLHPTSLPGEYGVGDIGPQAYRFVDWLVTANCRVWQVLPLNPPGYGNSPYASLSAFAANPLLISPELLRDWELVTINDLALAQLPEGRCDFVLAADAKRRLLDTAYRRFSISSNFEILRKEFTRYREQQRSWLDGWCAYRSLKTLYGGRHWRDWQVTPVTATAALESLTSQIEQIAFEQFLFDRQWALLRDYAAERGIRIIGDMPLFVADDSADTWLQRDLFTYGEDGFPTQVAGVPPDYFSETGQLWGNPQYLWENHQRDGFQWWIDRIKRVLQHTDIVRIDHFRGLAASWSVAAGAQNAIKGTWVKAPGKELLEAVNNALGAVPLIAEDLGLITPDVAELRDRFALPGMKVLHFAWGADAFADFLPHMYERNCLVYTCTHDNNTTVGWYKQDATEYEKDHLRRYLGVSGDDIAWDLIRAAWRSVATVAIVPIQDVLVLGGEHRMNLPGTDSDNWNWRLLTGQLDESYAMGLGELTELYGRTPEPASSKIIPEKYPL